MGNNKINEDELKKDINEEGKKDKKKNKCNKESKEILKDNINKELKKELEEKNEMIKDLIKSNEKLEDESTKIKNGFETLKERLENLSSEYENYRNRTAKEKAELYDEACIDVLNNMLPVLDNLERALDANGSMEDLKEGVELTFKQFKDSLTKLNVEEISTKEGFDPKYHNAVMHVVDDKYKENEIAEVLQKGYKRGEKVIRYSMVKVAN